MSNNNENATVPKSKKIHELNTPKYVRTRNVQPKIFIVPDQWSKPSWVGQCKIGMCPVYTPVLYSLHSLLIVLFHLDTIIKESNLTYHLINATQGFLVDPLMIFLGTPRYWCYLLLWFILIANRTIICEYLSFENGIIKKEWREY